MRVRPEELLLPRHAEGLSDQPVRPPAQRRRLGSSWPTVPWWASSGPTSRRTPGKSTHVGGGGRIHDAEYSLVDYNRAGVPLLEIVSRPDIRSAEQAVPTSRSSRPSSWPSAPPTAGSKRGRCGSTPTCRCARRDSDELRTRCEIKNVNSLRSLVRAIEYEAARHIDLWSHGEAPRQETRHWDEAGRADHPGRSKEEAEDYRYFAEPDLVPVEPDPAWIDDDPRRAAGVAGGASRAGWSTSWVPTGSTPRRWCSADLDQLVAEAAAAGAAGRPGPDPRGAQPGRRRPRGAARRPTWPELISMEAEGR